MRTSRQVSEREIAINLVIELAESGLRRFSLRCAYDDDTEFFEDLVKRLDVETGKPIFNKVRKVVRRLVALGVLTASMDGTHKEYVGEPTHQMNYQLKNGKADLLTRGKTKFTWDPEVEASFLLRNAYPKPDKDDSATSAKDGA